MVQVDPESGAEEKRITEAYNVKGYPTFLITYPHNKQVKRVHPFKKGKNLTTDEFVLRMKKAIEGQSWVTVSDASQTVIIASFITYGFGGHADEF